MKKQIREWIIEDKDEIVLFLSQLISSHNPNDVEDTREPLALVKSFLEQENCHYQEITHTAKMPNLLSSLEMSQDGKHLMLNGHLDILPVGNLEHWEESPFSGLIQEDKVLGRGAADMKAGLVAMLYAYKYIGRLKNNLSGKLSLSVVSDEETGWGRGTGYLFSKNPDAMTCDAVLLAEPTHAEGIAISSKGYTQFTIEIKSTGAITGYNNLSNNPVSQAIEIIQELKKLESLPHTLPKEILQLFADKDYKDWYEKRFGHNMLQQLSKITFDISEFHAGESPVMIPQQASFTVMMVTPVGINRQNILARIRRIVKKYPQAHMTVLGGDDGEFSSPQHPLFTALQKNISETLLTTVKPVAEIAISDARYWRYRGTPAYWYGLNGDTVGMPNESVSIQELLNVIEIYSLTILSYPILVKNTC